MASLGTDTAHYFSQGTGRDSYIGVNNGGLYSGRYGDSSARFEKSMRGARSNHQSHLNLRSTKYRKPLTQAQIRAARKQRESTNRLSQLSHRQQHDRHINQTRRIAHNHSHGHYQQQYGGGLPNINGTAKGMFMSQSVPMIRGPAHMGGSPSTMQRRTLGRSRNSHLTAAQKTVRRRARARRIKAQLDEQAHEELTRRYRSPAKGGIGNKYARRNMNRNLPSLGKNGSPVPNLRLGAKGIGAGAVQASAQPAAPEAASPPRESNKVMLRSITKHASSSSVVREEGEWYGIERKRVPLSQSTLARKGLQLPDSSEVIMAYDAPHEGAMAGMIITTSSGARVLASNIDHVAKHASGQYSPPKMKSKLPMLHAIDMPTN